MTAIQEFLQTRLSAVSAVTALVGTRIYYVKMPDNPTFPAITYQVVSGEHEESFQGSSNLRKPIIQIDSWATNGKAAYELSEAIREALQGYRGTVGDLVVQNILEWSEVDLYDTDNEIFHVSSSCRVWYYINV